MISFRDDSLTNSSLHTGLRLGRGKKCGCVVSTPTTSLSESQLYRIRNMIYLELGGGVRKSVGLNSTQFMFLTRHLHSSFFESTLHV